MRIWAWRHRFDPLRATLSVIGGAVIAAIATWGLNQAPAASASSMYGAIIGAASAVLGIVLLHAVRDDADLLRIKSFRRALDRPAFKASFANEVSSEDFDKAIEDTVTAFNTGSLYNRDGRSLGNNVGGVGDMTRHISDLMSIQEDLAEIRLIYRDGQSRGRFRFFEYNGSYFQPESDQNLSDAIDNLKIRIIRTMNGILSKEGLEPLPEFLQQDAHRSRA